MRDFVVPHPYRKERGMDGARWIFGNASEKYRWVGHPPKIRPDKASPTVVATHCRGRERGMAGFALLWPIGHGIEAASVNDGGKLSGDAEAFLTAACPVIGSYGVR